MNNMNTSNNTNQKENIVNLIQDNDYRKEICTNAKKRAAVFSVPEVMGKWIKLFNDTRL